jgi:hypothetical protein
MTFTDDEIGAAIDYLRDSSSRAAEARAQVGYLEQWLRSLRATLALRAVGSSMAEREAIALSHADYLAAIDAYKVAVEADAKFRFLREAAKAKIEAWQTHSANERATRI